MVRGCLWEAIRGYEILFQDLGLKGMDFMIGFHTVMDCDGLAFILELRVLGCLVCFMIDE